MSKSREIARTAQQPAGWSTPTWHDQGDGEWWLTSNEPGAEDGYGHILLIVNHGTQPPGCTMRFLEHFLPRAEALLDVAEAAEAELGKWGFSQTRDALARLHALNEADDA